MTRVSAEGARRGWGRETGSESGLWAGAGGLWERAGKGACSAWRRKSKHRRSEGAMAMAPWRTPGRRVHSEPTRRPIVRSAALKGAEAERWLQRSLLRSTIQWTRAWPSLLLAGGKRAPFSRRPSLTPESTTSWWIPVGFYEVWKHTHARRSDQASHGSRKQEERC